MIDYVSLHNHTSWSIMDSLIDPGPLFSRTKELGQKAVAVTDHGTLSGAWDSLKESKKTGVKLIIGCEFYFVDDFSKDDRFRHLILLAKNANGYKNLLKISKLGYDNKILSLKKVVPRIDWDIIKNNSDDLICTTACGSGILSRLIINKEFDKAFEQAKVLKDIYGNNFTIEIQAHALKRASNAYGEQVEQVFVNRKLIEIAKKLDVKVIVTTDAHYVYPEQWENHDAILALNSGQPIKSPARLKYNVNDFYIKSGDEIFEKLSRNYGEEFARDTIANTVYFADQCEFPDWIDPKYSNASGKELPEFPVKNQPDFNEFASWYAENYTDKPIDVAYLAYWCDKEFKKLVPKDKEKIYKDRLAEELEVIEAQNFASYFLIVADYINWAKKKGILVGVGRGCLDGEAKVLTNNGFKNLSNVNIGDAVYTHTGLLKKVLNKFEYDVNEIGLNIKTNYSFNNIKLTKDHKVYAIKSRKTKKYDSLKANNRPSTKSVRKFEKVQDPPTWIKASDLKKDDFIYMPFPKRAIKNNLPKIDLLEYSKNIDAEYDDQFIYQKIPLQNILSIRTLSKISGISRNKLKDIKKNGTDNKKYIEKINEILYPYEYDIDSFISNDNKYAKKINRFINQDDNFFYFLGRWIGDGWIVKTTGGAYITGVAFNSDDTSGIEKIKNYFETLGFAVYENKSSTKKLVQLTVTNKCLFNLLESFFPDYKYTSNTKHMPTCFRVINNKLLESLLYGLIDSDGHIDSRTNIDTTSQRLALELKEALLYLGINSSVITRKAYMRGKYRCNEAYKIRCKNFPLKNNYKQQHGYFSKILDISECKLFKVYDISVQDDLSYLTTNYAVHNSVGGSLTAYLLNIHIADPIKHDLVFARFLNKFKQSMPDIDTDFSSFGRDHVQEYIRNKYGHDNVAHVSNINTLTPKVYAKAISRIYEYGGDRKEAVKVGNKIADAIPSPAHSDVKTVADAFEKAPLFIEYSKRYPELKKLSNDIGGKFVAWSTHAGGILIGKRPLADIVPLRRDKDGNLSVEYDKERAEENGLVKMDTLCVETLDIIEKTKELIKQNGKEMLHFDYEMYDEATYNMIGEGNTLCVFQLGTSGGTIDLCRKIKPKSLNDLAIINALARPSARDIREDFIKTKNGELEVSIMHPSLERAFRPTFGFGLYEESLMYLAQDVAGWDLHDADKLRKLTKEKGKNPKKVEQWRKDFIAGAIKNNISERIATDIWDNVVAGFQGYGFNKSHAIFYSMVGFETAFLKAHYPLEFLTANLMFKVNSNSPDAQDKVNVIKEEIKKYKVTILPPDINKSSMSYTILNDTTLLTGLDALKFVSNDAISEILKKRPFSSFEDFLSKVDGKLVRSPAIQALAASGSLDLFSINRKIMFLYAQDFKKKLQVHLKKNKGTPFNYPWPEEGEWTIPERNALERKYIGEGLTGSKLEIYGNFFSSNAVPFSELPKLYPKPDPGIKSRDKNIVYGIEGEVKNIFEFKVKKEDSKLFGKTMARIELEDIHGSRINMVCFPSNGNSGSKDYWKYFQDRFKELSGNKFKLEEGVAVIVIGQISWYDEELSIIFEQLSDVAPPPQPPKELTNKNISLPKSNKSKSVISIKETTDDDILEEIEDELIESGDINLDED